MTSYVYLDQFGWIDLRNRDGKDSVKQSILQSVEEDKIRTPIIQTLFHETAIYNDKREREEHLEFMLDVSKVHALRDFNTISEYELKNYISQVNGREYDLLGKIRVQGIPDMYGEWTVEVEGEDITEHPDIKHKELMEEFEELTEDNEQIMDILTSEELMGSFQSRKWVDELTNEVEDIREELNNKFDSNKRRRRAAFRRYLINHIISELSYRLRLDFELVYDFDKYVQEGAESVDKLFQNFPSRYTYITLNNARDLQKTREIKTNDIYDLFSLSVAIPYSDVVVTENFWKTEAKRANLDGIYNTDIVSDIDRVIDILNL